MKLFIGLLLVALSVNVWSSPMNSNDISEQVSNNEEAVSGSGNDESADEQDQITKRTGSSDLPNIGYLFEGYNLIQGNPLDPRGYDPGFSGRKIFQATYEKNSKTSDGRYSIPDRIDAGASTACSIEASSETLSTEKQYKDSLNVKASASASGSGVVWEASFSASAEYDRVSSNLRTNSKSIIKSEATCATYDATMHNNPPPKFTENFINNLKSLQSNKDCFDFLEQFGTHFVERVHMGSRFGKVQTMSKENMENLENEGIDVSAAASGSLFGSFKASASGSVTSNNDEGKKFEKHVQETKQVSFGSRPPADGQTSTWIEKSSKNPYPVYYKLRSIMDIFKPQYFEETGVEYKKIKAKLGKYLKSYCKDFKDKHPNLNAECSGPKKGCAGGSICSANAECIDTSSKSGDGIMDQDYNCKCKDGYKGNGLTCQKHPQWTDFDLLYPKIYDNRVHGSMGHLQYCPSGVLADGFVMRSEIKASDGDETAANAICIICQRDQKCSLESAGTNGEWSDEYKCPKGSYLTGLRINYQEWQDNIDNTLVNNVEYRCRDLQTGELQSETLKGNGPEFGKWSRYEECPNNMFICGINVYADENAFEEDNFGIERIIHTCCGLSDKKKKKIARWFILMANLAGLALIRSTISAIGLLLTNIIWDKWQKCHMTVGNTTMIYRTGLWDMCIDHHLVGKTVCTPLEEGSKTTKLRMVRMLIIIALCLQSSCVILGLIVYRFAKYRRMILIPLTVNIAAALSGLIGLSIYATDKVKMNCELSSSYIIGWFGIAEALLCCLFFSLVAFGK